MERDFLDKLFQVLRNFTEYGNYQGKIDKAVAAIKKSYPDRSKEELTALFQNCVSAYKGAIELVKANVAYYASLSKDELEAETQFKKKHSEVPDQMLQWILGWIYHWHYER